MYYNCQRAQAVRVLLCKVSPCKNVLQLYVMGLLGTVPYLGLRRGWIAGWAGSLQQSLCFDSYMGASPEHECKTLIQCVRVMCCVLCVPPFYLRHCCLLCCCGPMSHALPLPPCRPGLTIGVPVGSPLPGLDAPCTAAYCGPMHHALLPIVLLLLLGSRRLLLRCFPLLHLLPHPLCQLLALLLI